MCWFRICLSRDETNAASNLFNTQNRKWSPWERCRRWSTIYETEITLETQAKLTESAFYLSFINLWSQFWTKLTQDWSEMTVQNTILFKQLVEIYSIFVNVLTFYSPLNPDCQSFLGIRHFLSISDIFLTIQLLKW